VGDAATATSSPPDEATGAGLCNAAGMPTRRTLVAAFVAIAATAVLAAGCGGSNSSPTTTAATSAETWANSLCLAISTYRTSLENTVTSVTASPSAAGIKSAATQAETATTTFITAVKGLGKPNTSSGQQAQDDVSNLATKLSDDLTTIKNAVAGISGAAGIVSAISVGSTTLVDAQNQITSTYHELKSLPTGELRQALKTAPACMTLSKG
jgi:hypothetical protein